MPTATVKPKQISVQQRATQATSLLRQIIARDDLKLLSIALSEVASEEASSNKAFAERVRKVYDELAAIPKTSNRSRKVATPAQLTPINVVEGYKIGPGEAPDPYVFRRIYGDAQLRTALDSFNLTLLKGAADMVMKRNPGTKPKSRSKRDDILDYIIDHVVRSSQ